MTVKLTLADKNSPFWLDILVYDWAGDELPGEKDLWEAISWVRSCAEACLIKEKTNLTREYWDEPLEDSGDRQRIEGIYERLLGDLPKVTEKRYIYRGIDSVCGAWQQLFPAERIFPLRELEF